jgi:hypothetical protein
MRSLSRRGFLAVGGSGVAGAALAACGTSVETRDSDHDTELLDAALDAEATVEATATAAAKTPTEAQAEHELIEAIASASNARAEKLRTLGEGTSGGQASAAGDTLADLARASADAVAAYRPAAGQLSTPQLRTTAITYMARSAAELAGLRGLLGEDPAPQPFVTGGAEKPFVEPTATTTSTTTTDSTSTATGG